VDICHVWRNELLELMQTVAVSSGNFPAKVVAGIS